ncbi:nucleotidyltransferase domain-containing protein [Candidatus Woesearchaeota archaeon]|nr:nucleotidyltransferase domain-containing protein [Candidatus Woesearchaeota archaeon]
MELKIAILKPFFESPGESFHIREVAKIAGISHTAAGRHIKQLQKEGCLTLRHSKPYDTYKANASSKKYLNLKLYYNLEKLRASGLIEKLEQHHNYPVIALFGSFAKALDDEKSDVDLCIISEVKESIDLKAYEKALRRTISIHKFDKKSWETAKKKNQGLINSICNGIVLSGQLEVL